MTAEQGSQLRVEVYGQGGWWKASDGQSGQVSRSEARKAPVAVVAMVANQFGMDGWELTHVVSQAHGGYHLSFELAYEIEDEGQYQ